jgi:hypothetical protein
MVEGDTRADLVPGIAVVLPEFLRANPGKLRQGSGHRCSGSGRIPTSCRKSLPGREDSGSGESWFEPRRGNSKVRYHFGGSGLFVLRPLLPFLLQFLERTGRSTAHQLRRRRHHPQHRRLVSVLVARQQGRHILPATGLGHVLERQLLALRCPLPPVRVPGRRRRSGDAAKNRTPQYPTPRLSPQMVVMVTIEFEAVHLPAAGAYRARLSAGGIQLWEHQFTAILRHLRPPVSCSVR